MQKKAPSQQWPRANSGCIYICLMEYAPKVKIVIGSAKKLNFADYSMGDRYHSSSGCLFIPISI